MIILPIRTSIQPWRTPYANYGLILVNAIIFAFSFWPHHVGQMVELLRPWAEPFVLNPNQPHVWQFLSYAFLHGGYLHIIGNMFFLYIFGNNINDKLGHVGYICFYMAGAVFSGVGHCLLSSSPVLGASGAVSAITGAYLVLFPQTSITVFYWLFFFIDTINIPALYFIAFKLIIFDNLLELKTLSSIAYGAHLSGYAFGIAAILLLLATGLLSSSGLDLWSMLKRWNQRRRYRDVISSGYDPFTGYNGAKWVKVKEIQKSPLEKEQEEKITQLRNEISSRMAQRNIAAAAESYLELMKLDNTQLLQRQQLLDIANQLASENRSIESVQAYEQFLAHYSTYEYIEQVELMLGILYSRYLHQPALAVKHLQAAVQRLSDPGQLKMCREELANLQS